MEITLPTAEIGTKYQKYLDATPSSKEDKAFGLTLLDLWEQTTVTVTDGTIRVTLAPHASAAYRIL